MEIELQDNEVDIVPLMLVSGNEGMRIQKKVALINFPYSPDSLRTTANSGAPADGVSVNSIYFDSTTINPKNMAVILSGYFIFADTFSNQRIVTFGESVFDATFDIVNTRAEQITISFVTDSYGSITCTSEFMPFV